MHDTTIDTENGDEIDEGFSTFNGDFSIFTHNHTHLSNYGRNEEDSIIFDRYLNN